MAIGGCIHGFISSIRPIIAIDGMFLKGKFKGTLFITTTLDGNNQLYPVAFSVGDSENDASWVMRTIKGIPLKLQVILCTFMEAQLQE